MVSVVDQMTDQQRELLKRFKESLKDYLNSNYTDELLVKFLRARNFNLKATRKIFLEFHYNCTIFEIGTILETYKKPEVAEEYESTSFIGFAKDGTLIRYVAAGRLDFYGFIMSMSCFELCLYFSHIMEFDIKRLKEESLKTGKNLTEVTYIVDLEKFAMQQVLHQNVIEMGMDFTRLIQDAYPEIWRNVLIVNAPRIFNTAFGLFKSVMRSTVLEKIQLAGKNATKDLLLKYVDEDVLPAFLGGKRLDSTGDPMCKEFLTFGGKIPEKLYSKNSRIQLSLEDPEVRCVSIGPRSMFNLSVVILEPGTKIKFQSRTESGSISLSALFKELDPDPSNTKMPGEFEYLDENSENFKYKQISVEIRGQIHNTQEDMFMTAPWRGLYIIRFSNASNWFTSRKLYVKCKAIPPKSQSLLR